MTLTISIQLTDAELLQTVISLAGAVFTACSFAVNCWMLKKMT